MLSNLIILVVSFIIVLVIVAEPEPVEYCQSGWYLSSEGWKEIQKRDKVKRRINQQKDEELSRIIIDAEEYDRLVREQDLERRRKAFREWKDNCDRIFNPVAS